MSLAKEKDRLESETAEMDGLNNITIITMLVAIFLTIVLLIKRRSSNFFKHAAKIPGPPTIPFLGNALQFLALSSTQITYKFIEIMEKYEGTSRIWLGDRLFVLVSDPKDIEIVLNSSKLIEKNEIYTFFENVLGKGLLTASGELWKRHRKLITPTFQTPVLKHFLPIFTNQGDVLVKRLKKEVEGKGTIEIFPYVRDCAVDLIAETAFEFSLNAQTGSVIPQLQAAERMMAITFERIFKVWLHPEPIFLLTPDGQEYLKCQSVVKNFVTPLVKQRKEEVLEQIQNTDESEIKAKSFIRSFLSFDDKGKKFSDQELIDEVMTIVITGYETAASSMAFLLVMMGIHQDVQDKVYKEIVEMEYKLQGRELEIEDLQQLTYMDMVFKEVLRLYPLAPIIFRKATGDVKLATCTIPKGASVSLVILQAQRDPKYWKDPLVFDPERFQPEEIKNAHPYSYIPFSAGPRGCIGKKYADMAVKTVLYKILKEFHVYSDKKQSEVNIKIEVTLKMTDGFKIRLEPRNPEPEPA